jgi:hypothetical protein
MLSFEPFANNTTTFGLVESGIITSLSIRDAFREPKACENDDELACPDDCDVSKRMKSVAIMFDFIFSSRKRLLESQFSIFGAGKP